MRFLLLRSLLIGTIGASVAWCATLGLQPYLQDVRPDRATILWTTLEAAGSGEVRYAGGSVVSQSKKYSPADTGVPYDFWLHKAVLTGLKAATEYSFGVYLDGSLVTPNGDLRVRTPAAKPLVFLAFGDSGDGAAPQQTLARLMSAEGAEFILHAGDLAYEDGSFLQLWNFFFDAYRGMLSHVPAYAVPGNHDYRSAQATPFRTLLSPPTDGVPAAGRGLYYSFDWGLVHVTALDSNAPLTEGSEMLRWLEHDLAATRNQYRIAIFHHTPFPTGHHLGDPTCDAARESITPILERHGVHLVLNGHEHVYQRTSPRRNGVFDDSTWGTVYVTTGGGGYNLHVAGTAPFVKVGISVNHYLRLEVNGDTMRVRAIGTASETIDEFALSGAASLDSVTDAAEYRQHFAPGGLVSIFGKDLARVFAEAAQGGRLSPTLADVSVMVNGAPAPLAFAGRSQVNVQFPYGLAAGPARVQLAGPNGTVEKMVQIAATAPAVFPGAITHANGSPVSSSAPARGGEWLSVYLTGLGAVTPPVPAGEPAPPSPLSRAVAGVRVTLNGTSCEVSFAGLAPGLPGVNQVNFRIPSSFGAGDAALAIIAGEASSASMNVPISN